MVILNFIQYSPDCQTTLEFPISLKRGLSAITIKNNIKNKQNNTEPTHIPTHTPLNLKLTVSSMTKRK